MAFDYNPLTGFGLFGSGHSTDPVINGIAQDPVNNSQNSLTQFIRSVGNTSANTGVNYGTSGTDLVKSGQPSVATGQADLSQSTSALAPVISYFSKLLGSNADLTSALQPQFDQVSQQFNSIRNAISATAPRGGGTASTFAAAPFEEAKTKGQIAQQARAGAATGLQGAATASADIGAKQAGIGLAESGIGAEEQSLGLQALGEAIQTGLGEKGLDIQGGTANSFANVANALSALI